MEEYNNTRHSVTGFAPNYLLYGKRIEIAPKGIIENKIDLEREKEEAFKSSMRNFEINKQKYDKKKSMNLKLAIWSSLTMGTN